MSEHVHPTDSLEDLLDGRLPERDRLDVERHLDTCDACRRTFDQLSSVKRALRGLAEPDLPGGLGARVAAALDAADREVEAGAAVPAAGRGRRARWWLAGLAGAAAVLVAALFWPTSEPSLPALAARAFDDAVAGRIDMGSPAADAATAQAYLEPRVTFPVRVFDLGMMGYTIAGARVHALNGRATALWVYRGTAGSLVCEMYRGVTADLPRAAESRDVNGITFHIYHEGGGTQVFWQEGDVVCVLSSTIPSEDVVQLAVAKAMKP